MRCTIRFPLVTSDGRICRRTLMRHAHRFASDRRGSRPWAVRFAEALRRAWAYARRDLEAWLLAARREAPVWAALAALARPALEALQARLQVRVQLADVSGADVRDERLRLRIAQELLA